MTDIEYTLVMNREQAHEALKAVELLMRLKLNQPEEISRAILDGKFGIDIGCDEYCKRRDASNTYLRLAFDHLYTRPNECRKDAEWYKLYNIYQVLRYAIHNAEHPETTGVDSYEPMQLTEEVLPECYWERVTDD